MCETSDFIKTYLLPLNVLCIPPDKYDSYLNTLQIGQISAAYSRIIMTRLAITDDRVQK